MKITLALIKKEILQIIRDPSTILVAFIIPAIMMVIYMYGVNLDTPRVYLGVRIEDTNPELRSFVDSISKSKYMTSYVYTDKDSMYKDISDAKINGAIIIPNDFTEKLEQGGVANLLVITDGAALNSANYVQSYVTSAANTWLSLSKYAHNIKSPIVNTQVRLWYNQSINSHHFILPGSMAITMNLVGLLLTSLVIAREWERGTMESLLGTHITALQLVAGKYVPYFILAMLSCCFSLVLCVQVFGVPFHGSIISTLFVCSLFILCCIGLGLTISTIFKNQFLACQAALGVGFMPAQLLSGLMFPINSMPEFFQTLTMLLPPRYFVTFIESEFLAGTIPKVVFTSAMYLAILSVLLFAVVYKKTYTRLEDKVPKEVKS
ncbi:MAG: ABC transporter permease [Phascolarctobacterium sp.]|nr:ABC transporter permease [Phascolarctobacterium sp.]